MDQKKLSLQPRLQMLANLVPQGTVVADIGTDHGYLPVWLLQEGRIKHAIASDINARPLDHARQTAAEYGVDGQIEFRLCSGLDCYTPGEADTIVIAGMGGETIVSILESAPWTRRAYLLLQPMTKTEYLRTWLADKGYSFTAEQLVFDKDFLYPILCVTGGESRALTEAEAYGGVLLEHDPLWGQYLDQQIKRVRIKIDGLASSGKDSALPQINQLEALYAALAARKEKANVHGTRN